MVRNGELAAGEKVNEFVLAERLAISRGPVREALRNLEGSGLVCLEKNRGVFVRVVTTEEAENIYTVRAALDRLIGETLARRVTPAQLARLHKLVERMHLASQAGDIDSYYPLNLEFHDLLIEGAANPTLASMSRRLIDELHLFRRRSLVQGGGLSVSNREHHDIVGALEAGDPDAAGQAMYRHVIAARDRLFKSLEASRRTGSSKSKIKELAQTPAQEGRRTRVVQGSKREKR